MKGTIARDNSKEQQGQTLKMSRSGPKYLQEERCILVYHFQLTSLLSLKVSLVPLEQEGHRR